MKILSAKNVREINSDNKTNLIEDLSRDNGIATMRKKSGENSMNDLNAAILKMKYDIKIIKIGGKI